MPVSFGTHKVGSTKAKCPLAKPRIYIVDDGGLPTAITATINSRVEISNRVTNDGSLPAGFLDPSTDRDNFKIEVQDSTIKGNTIPASAVEVEVLRKNKRSFKSPRKIHVELQRVGTSNIFRSRYIRAVVDDLDQASVLPPNQTILTDWDEDHPLEEILGQVVRATYSYTDCGEKAQTTWHATVGSDQSKAIRLVVHILRKNVGGDGVVAIADAKRRIRKWFRRAYAQISLAPYLINTHYVDPLENLISISNDHGKSATGGTGSSISFTVHATPPKGKIIIKSIGPYEPSAGDTPITTANNIAALIRTTSVFNARTVQNPATLEPTITQGSADIIITHSGGARISIQSVICTDATQTLHVPRISASNFRGWGRPPAGAPAGAVRPANYNAVGSIEQRTLFHNYDSGSDRVEFMVVETLDSGDRGQAFSACADYGASKKTLPFMVYSAFVIAETMDGTDKNPFTCSHECGHTLLDAGHAQQSNQVMRSGTSGANLVTASKRFFETAVPFENPPIPVVQETRIRANGAATLRSIV